MKFYKLNHFINDFIDKKDDLFLKNNMLDWETIFVYGRRSTVVCR